MAKLDPSTINEFVEILKPFLEDHKDRKAFLISALGSNQPVLSYIEWSGSVATFIPRMLDKLENFGDKQALCDVLEYTKSQVGEDKQQRISQLLNKLQKQDFSSTSAPPPLLATEEKYRKEVEKNISDGKISDIGRRILNELRQKLGVSQETAERIEAETLQPFKEYQKHLDEFLQILVEQIHNNWPFSTTTQRELREIAKKWNLKKEDIEKIYIGLSPDNLIAGSK